MTDADRREFLKKLAKSAAYATPVITTFAVPAELLGQGMGSQHMHLQSRSQDAPAPAPDAAAPWDKPAPGTKNP
ncbi:MAG: hypothetical protein V3T56_02225 [Gemmatimonadales bacterium]